VARLQLQIVLLHGHLQPMIGAVLLHLFERNLEQVDVFGTSGEFLESAFEVIAVVKVNSTTSAAGRTAIAPLKISSLTAAYPKPRER
jgi:hypothetical protein